MNRITLLIFFCVFALGAFAQKTSDLWKIATTGTAYIATRAVTSNLNIQPIQSSTYRETVYDMNAHKEKGQAMSAVTAADKHKGVLKRPLPHLLARSSHYFNYWGVDSAVFTYLEGKRYRLQNEKELASDYFLYAAKSGNLMAQYEYGMSLLEDSTFLDEGIKWIEKATKNADKLRESYYAKLAEVKFSLATKGIPLKYPLAEISKPCISLLLVACDKNNLRIDKVYLVDATLDKFDYHRDIYQIDSIKSCRDDGRGIVGHFAVASNSGKKREIEIDEVILKEIRKINMDKSEFKSNIKIPIVSKEISEK